MKTHSTLPIVGGEVFLYVEDPNRYNIPAFFELRVSAKRDNPQGPSWTGTTM
ncbi:MAG: hypothetical protein WA639_16005 [Candidatus Acidiferrum sp.]